MKKKSWYKEQQEKMVQRRDADFLAVVLAGTPTGLLPGGLGTLISRGEVRDISAINVKKDGSTTMTISAPKKQIIVTEDVDAEIVPNKQKLLP